MKALVLLSLFYILLNAQVLQFSAGKNNVVHKVASEVLHRAYTRIGIEPEFSYINLQESLILSNSGQIDGEIARIKVIHKKFPNLIEVPVVISYVEGAAFSKNTSLYIANWNDLKPYRIGIAKGAKFIETGTKGMNRIFYKGFKAAFFALDKGEIDLVVTPKSTGKYIIHEEGFKDIKMVGETLQKLDLYHFLHKKNKHLIPKITPVLQEMKKSGEIQYIRGYYFRKIIR